MKVLLINPPMQVNREPEVQSFGIAYIVQELKSHGYDVDILDVDAYRYPKQEVTEFIKKTNADIVGIGGLVTVYPYLHWLVPEIKRLKPSIEIILGGPVASSLKDKCFEKFPIDYAVIGEGEITIIELLRELCSNRNFNSIDGIGFRRNEKIIFTNSRSLMASLDKVPMFDDTLFPMEKLLNNTGGVFQIHTQRGCPSNCTFCFNSFRVISKHVRYRPIANVVKEIEIFQEKYKDKITLFALSGECITMNKSWIINFCKTIIERGLKIDYRVTSRVDTIDEERLEWLKRSGCTRMSLGLESGSDKILKIMKKGTTAADGKKAVLLAKRYIPDIEASVILGYLGDNRDTLKETVKFCKEIEVRPSLFYATPFPGTELYSASVQKGFIRDEENYMMGLDKQLIFVFSLNLTDMQHEEAAREIKAAHNEIIRYYILREIISLKMFKYIARRLKEYGLAGTIVKIFKRITEIYF